MALNYNDPMWTDWRTRSNIYDRNPVATYCFGAARAPLPHEPARDIYNITFRGLVALAYAYFYIKNPSDGLIYQMETYTRLRAECYVEEYLPIIHKYYKKGIVVLRPEEFNTTQRSATCAYRPPRLKGNIFL